MSADLEAFITTLGIRNGDFKVPGDVRRGFAKLAHEQEEATFNEQLNQRLDYFMRIAARRSQHFFNIGPSLNEDNSRIQALIAPYYHFTELGHKELEASPEVVRCVVSHDNYTVEPRVMQCHDFVVNVIKRQVVHNKHTLQLGDKRNWPLSPYMAPLLSTGGSEAIDYPDAANINVFLGSEYEASMLRPVGKRDRLEAVGQLNHFLGMLTASSELDIESLTFLPQTTVQ